MRAHAVVVFPPIRKHGARLIQRREQRLVEALVSKPADKTLGEGVLLRLARLDVVPRDIAILLPRHDRHAGELRTVVGNACSKLAAPFDDSVKFAADTPARQRGFWFEC